VTTSRVSTAREGTLRVAVIGPLMMPNRQGGMSRHCEEIYARLAERGHAVSIYCSSRPQGARYRGMTLRRVPALGIPGWDRLAYSLLATVLATFGRYDVVHYHSLANTGFCFLPRLAAKRVVVTIHRIEWQDEKWGAVTRQFLRWSEWCALRFANAVISVSTHLKDDVTRRNRRGRDILVISNGVAAPGDTGRTGLDALGVVPGGYLLSVGRLVPDKGWDIALEGIALLDPAETTGLEYVIAGGARIETDYVRALHERAGDAELPVRLLGMVPPETVEELYAGARVHLAPSFQEGQPLTVLEAMSHGCCIVASDIPAHREVIGDTGVLYAVKEPAALADALRRVLADDDLRRALGARARAAIEERDELSWDRAAESTEAVLESLGRGR
jgi:glycosyltransferase involved in cell wall biosynthesis